MFLTVCSAFVRDGTNANEMGSLCVYLWGDYLEKTKNKQINKTFSKQSVSFVKPRGTDSPPSTADAIETRTFALRTFQSSDHKLRLRYSKDQLCHDITRGFVIFGRNWSFLINFRYENAPISARAHVHCSYQCLSRGILGSKIGDGSQKKHEK